MPINFVGFAKESGKIMVKLLEDTTNAIDTRKNARQGRINPLFNRKRMPRMS